MKGRLRMCAAVLAVGVGLLAPGTASARVVRGMTISPQAGGSFNFGSIASGQSATQTFTISTGGRDQWSGRLFVWLTRRSAFSVVSDGCSGTELSPARSSCQVSVKFAPTSARRGNFAVLSVFGSRWGWWGWRWRQRFSSTVVLRGAMGGSGGGGGGGGGVGGTGPASLQLSPSTPVTGDMVSYEFGQVHVASQTFTLTNVGGDSSLPLSLNGWSNGGGFALSGDTCTSVALAGGASCTFTETWTTDNEPSCDGMGHQVGIDPSITSADTSVKYADVVMSAVCG